MTTLNKYHQFYGYFRDPQLLEESKFLHNKIQQLLYSKEEEDPKIDRYFERLLYTLAGMNEIEIYCKPEMITLMSLIQAARLEAHKPDYNHTTYKDIIFEAHSVLDLLYGGGSNDNTK